ncbi:flagellar hook-basal body complex protein FliE [Alkalihalobacillus oceani]|uniref:flagellar hook-basal body complex protein FliE n=1 Tax=Halalkalibacter oceani TaxID=1653776 RepID=UPI00203D007C|nr:flagellar hook-basal body complex protein FliE [Halalkalibacter oceani]MCM3759444.1 flagellar hook-basal body complex protein FliE [Halalkalibacter oceani]
MDIKIGQSPFVFQGGIHNQNGSRMSAGEAHQSFKTALNEAIEHVNSLQQESAQKTERLASGEIDDLHDVMITGQKASITLQATVEVRNKVIEAYQEIMRMQV